MNPSTALTDPELQNGLLRPELEILLLLGLGVLLATVAALINKVGSLMPMKTSRRALWHRIEPLLLTLTFLLYGSFALRVVLRQNGAAQWVALAIGAITLVAALFPLLRDVLAGVVVRAGQSCQVGDRVKLPTLEGQVTRLGLWSLAMETRDGQEALVPYGQLLRHPLLKNPVIEGGAPHVFRVQPRAPRALAELRRVVVETALSSYWASSVRDPQLRALGDNTFEVTVFALHADYGALIEADVRRVVDRT